MSRLNNDSKIQMKLNIQQHQQKLLQCLENSNDTVVKPKIKSVSNNLEKCNLNHNVKPKIASSTELISTKLEPTKVTNHKTRSYVQKKQFKPVVTTNEKNLEVLTDVDTKTYKTRSSVTLNQLQPNIKVNIQDEQPISNVELKPTPIPIIEKKDPEPIIKTLREQLIEELYNSSSSEDIDNYISVGSNEFSDINSKSDVHDNDNSNLIPVRVDKYYEHEQPDTEKSKKNSSYYSCDSDIAQFDINYPATKKSSKKSTTRRERIIHYAAGYRKRIAQHFDILSKNCTCLNTNIPSKLSILLAAKKEYDFLKHSETKLIEEKNLWHKINDNLKNRIAELTEMTE